MSQPLQKPSLNNATVNCCHAETKHSRDSFSKASDYLFAIAPVYLGSGYFLLKDYFVSKVQIPEIIYTGSVKANFGFDPSTYAHAGVFFLILFGVGTGIGLIYAMNRMEEWDTKLAARSSK